MSDTRDQSVQALMKRDMQLQAAQQHELEEGLVYADRFVNRQYLVNLDVHQAIQLDRSTYQLMRLYHVEKFIFDADENVNDKLISVYGALNAIKSNLVFVIKSHKTGVSFYIGTRCEQASTAGYILEKGLEGNFGGSQFNNLSSEQIQDVLSPDEFGRNACISSVTLVPSLRDEEKEHFVQGLEKLIDAMVGHKQLFSIS